MVGWKGCWDGDRKKVWHWMVGWNSGRFLPILVCHSMSFDSHSSETTTRQRPLLKLTSTCFYNFAHTRTHAQVEYERVNALTRLTHTHSLTRARGYTQNLCTWMYAHNSWYTVSCKYYFWCVTIVTYFFLHSCPNYLFVVRLLLTLEQQLPKDNNNVLFNKKRQKSVVIYHAGMRKQVQSGDTCL